MDESDDIVTLYDIANVANMVNKKCQAAGLQNETWINTYGRRCNFLSGFKDDFTMEELDKINGLLEPMFEVENGDFEVLLQALRLLQVSLVMNEYPKPEITVQVFKILLRAIEVDVNPVLVDESAKVFQQLLRHAPPYNDALKSYWRKVFTSALCGGDVQKPKVSNDVLREQFVRLLEAVLNVVDEKTSTVASLLSSVTDLLEIDLWFTLNNLRGRRCSGNICGSNAPLVSALFWGSSAYPHFNRPQANVIDLLMQILNKSEDTTICSACDRLLALFFELTRLTEPRQLVEKVAIETPMENLMNLFSGVLFFSVKKNLNLLIETTQFSWIQSVARRRRGELNE